MPPVVSQPIDYFGPAFHVRMLPRTDGAPVQIEEALPNDELGRSGQGADLTDYVTSLKVTVVIGGYSSCEIVLSFPYDFALAVFNRDTLNFGNVLAVRFGYPESAIESKTFYFTNSLPGVQFGAPRTTVTLKGQALGAEAGRREAYTTWDVHQRPRKALTVIEEIAADHNLQVVTDEQGDPSAGADPNGFPDGLVDPTRWKQPIMQMGTDREFIELLLRAGDARMTIENNKVKVQSATGSIAKRPVFLLRLYGQVNTAEGIFPMEQFNSDANLFFRSSSSIESQKAQGVNPRNRVVPPLLPNQPQANSDYVFAGNSYPGSPQLLNDIAQIIQDSTDPNSAFSQQQATAFPSLNRTRNQTGKRFFKVWEDAKEGIEDDYVFESTFMINAEIVTPGNPLFQPLQMIAVEGVGKFSGLYQIYEVLHTIEKGYKTTLKVRSNSWGSSQQAFSSFAVLDGDTGELRANTHVTTRVNNQSPISGDVSLLERTPTSL